jgi:hypothetical protein
MSKTASLYRFGGPKNHTIELIIVLEAQSKVIHEWFPTQRNNTKTKLIYVLLPNSFFWFQTPVQFYWWSLDILDCNQSVVIGSSPLIPSPLLPWFGSVTKFVERRNTQNKIAQKQQQITKFDSYKNCTTLFAEIARWSKRYTFSEQKKDPPRSLPKHTRNPFFLPPTSFTQLTIQSSLQSCKIREHP